MSRSNLSTIIISTDIEKSLAEAKKLAVKILGTDKSTEHHPDLQIFSGDPSIGIKQIQELIAHLSKKPYQADKTVAIIHPGNLMTTEAQNALLKILEEPPRYVYIYITATHINHLLPTIRSRCKMVEIEAETETNHNYISFIALVKRPLYERLQEVDSLAGKCRRKPDILEKMLDEWMLEVGSRHPKLLKRLIRAKELLHSNVTAKHVLDTACCCA